MTNELRDFVNLVISERYVSSVAHKATGDEKFDVDDIVDLVKMTVDAYASGDRTAQSVVPGAWVALEKGLAHDNMALQTYHVLRKKVSELAKLEKLQATRPPTAANMEENEDKILDLYSSIEDDAEELALAHKPSKAPPPRGEDYNIHDVQTAITKL